MQIVLRYEHYTTTLLQMYSNVKGNVDTDIIYD